MQKNYNDHHTNSCNPEENVSFGLYTYTVFFQENRLCHEKRRACIISLMIVAITVMVNQVAGLFELLTE